MFIRRMKFVCGLEKPVLKEIGNVSEIQSLEVNKRSEHGRGWVSMKKGEMRNDYLQKKWNRALKGVWMILHRRFKKYKKS